MSDVTSNRFYRNPIDLAVTPAVTGRVLVIGSCLLSALPEVAMSLTPSCIVEHLLTNNFGSLPSRQAGQLSDVAFQVVQVPMRSILPEGSYFRLSHANEAPFVELLHATKQRLSVALDAALTYATHHKKLTFVSNFLVPQVNPMGKLLQRLDLRNPVYFFQEVNRFLDQEIRRFPSTYVLDADAIASSIGKQFVQDDGLWQINHASALSDADVAGDQRRLTSVVPPSRLYGLKTYDFVAAIWSECLAMHRVATKTDNVKLVILDLDDTLWRGIFAEEGQTSIEGWPLGIAEALLFLKQRGIVLAIASKNDPTLIEANFDRLFGTSRLQLSDFAVRQIGWQSKIDSIGAIIRQVNVLPNSVVFVDDNPVEREAALAAFPGIRVLGETLYSIRRALLWSAETQVSVVTSESSKRSEMVTAQVERETQRAALTKEEFLRQLGVVVTRIEVGDVKHPRFERMVELVNKSNQFNTTGQRWALPDWDAAFVTGMRCHCFEVRDKFTEYGLVVVAILTDDTIRQFVMSCRVVGLGVEETAIHEVARAVARQGAATITGIVVHTSANSLASEFYPRTGFTEEAPGRWVLPISQATRPEHVQVVSPEADGERPPAGAAPAAKLVAAELPGGLATSR